MSNVMKASLLSYIITLNAVNTKLGLLSSLQTNTVRCYNRRHEQTNEMHMKLISREVNTCRGKFRAHQQDLNLYCIKVDSLTVESTFFFLRVNT